MSEINESCDLKDDEIRMEIINAILNSLKNIDESAVTEAEHKLLCLLAITLKDNIDFNE